MEHFTETKLAVNRKKQFFQKFRLFLQIYQLFVRNNRCILDEFLKKKLCLLLCYSTCEGHN